MRSLKFNKVLYCFLLTFFAACSSTKFAERPLPANHTSSDATGNPSADAGTETPREIDSANNGGESGDSNINGTLKVLHFAFEPGDAKPVTQKFLLVVDQSISMATYLSKVHNGFLSIPAESFPAGSKVGVITSLAAEENDYSAVGANIKLYPGIQSEPGFLGLVNRSAIKAFKANLLVSDIIKEQFSLEGCDQGWFDPNAENEKKESCLKAALQISATGVGCEPLALALKQFLEKHRGDASLIAKNEFLQVIFVTDAFHPGCSQLVEPAVIEKSCPTVAEINSALEPFALYGVKFHGILRMQETLDSAGKVIGEKNFGEAER